MAKPTYVVEVKVQDGSLRQASWRVSDPEGYGKPSRPMLSIWVERFEASTALKIKEAAVKHLLSGRVVVRYPMEYPLDA